MKPPNFASSKVKLAGALGIGRSLLYQFCRLPDAPPPRANGMWHIPTWRRFIASKRTAIELSEKEKLQLLLLKIRSEREHYELQVRRREVRETIRAEFIGQIDIGMAILTAALNRMPDELAPVFDGRNAVEIHKTWRQRLDEVLDQTGRTLRHYGEKNFPIASRNAAGRVAINTKQGSAKQTL